MARSSGWRRGALVVALVAALAASGWAVASAEWEVSWAIPTVCSYLERWTGWPFEMRRLWITPARRLRAEDLFVHPRDGGRLHVRSLEVRYRWPDLAAGSWPSQWWVRDVRMDPGSWRIQRPAAVETLSAGPVVDWMTLRVTADLRQIAVERIRAQGPLIRFHGAGTWMAGGQMRCWVRGQVSGPVLSALGVSRVHGQWEPFAWVAEGLVNRPRFRFHSRFFAFTMGQPREVS